MALCRNDSRVKVGDAMYRKSKLRLIRRVGGNVGVALIALGGAVAAASAMTHSAPVAPTATANTTVAKATVASPVTTLPATLVSKAPTATVHVSPESGIVTALSGTALTIQSQTGATFTYTIDGSTVVMMGRVKTTLANVHVGTRVFVMPSAASAATAAAIGIVPSTGEPSDGPSDSSDGTSNSLSDN